MNKKNVSRVGIGLGALLGVNLLTTELQNDLCNFLFNRDRPGYLESLLDSPSHEDWYYPIRDGAAERVRNIPHGTFTRKTKTGETLKGYFFPCRENTSEPRRIAVVVHGYHSEFADTLGMYYDYYHSRGFDIFIADNRAAGESEGTYITFDILESEDTLDWINTLVGLYGKETEIVLHGFSMGGATVLKCSDRVPPQVKFIVSDSGFSEAEGTLRPNLGFLYPSARRRFRKITGLDLNDSDVRPNLKNAKVPIVFFHGEKDPTVPFSMGEELYALCPTEKYKLFLPDAMHIECMYVDPEGYISLLDTAVHNHLNGIPGKDAQT